LALLDIENVDDGTSDIKNDIVAELGGYKIELKPYIDEDRVSEDETNKINCMSLNLLIV
jgi:hypothetical protein